MKFLRHLLILLAAGLLTLGIIMMGIDQKLLSSGTWLQQADQANVYAQLSEQLPKLAAAGDTADDARARAQIATIATPAAVRSELVSYLPTVEDYIRGRGPQPGQPLAGIMNQAKAATGIETMPTQDTPPSKGTEPSPALQGVQQALGLRLWLLVAGLVLAAIVWLMAPAGKRWWQILRLCIWTELGLAVWFGVIALLPGTLAGSLASNKDLGVVAPMLRAWLTGIAHVTNAFTLMAMIAIAAVAAVSLVLQLVTKALPNKPTKVTPTKASKSTSNLPVAR